MRAPNLTGPLWVPARGNVTATRSNSDGAGAPADFASGSNNLMAQRYSWRGATVMLSTYSASSCGTDQRLVHDYRCSEQPLELLVR